jgi:hypothetical protein
MIILFILILAILAVILFLRGEGDSYCNGYAKRYEKKSFKSFDKNYFL